MLGRLLRVLIGLAIAFLGAGVTLVFFVVTPSELAGLPPDVAGDRLKKTLELAGLVSIHIALFAAPFALLAAFIAEYRQSKEWPYYVLVGILIAIVGFLSQHSTEQIGQPTIVNNYAVLAFMAAGFVAGLLYWLVSGRKAGPRGRIAPEKPATTSRPNTASKPDEKLSAEKSSPSAAETARVAEPAVKKA